MTGIAAVDALEANAVAALEFDTDAEAKRLEDEAGPGLARCYLNGAKFQAKVADAVQDAEVAETMEGASTFTLSLHDPDDELLQSALFAGDVRVRVDDDDYELVHIASRPPQLTLTFEDDNVDRMRSVTKPRKARRSRRVSRVGFCITMVRDTPGKRIPVFAPERGPQPITRREPPKEKAKRKRERRNGFPAGADIEVKGVRANAAQRNVLDDVLEQGVDQKVNTRCLIGGVIAVTGESAAQNLGGGDRDSVGAFQQRRSQGWPATRNVKRDAREFYRRLVPLERRYGHSRKIGWLVDQVQRSNTFGTANQGAGYDRWVSEAEHTVDAWTGGGGAGSSDSSTKRRKPYEFRRGEPGKREDTWTALGRLMQEVRWRRFMRRGVLWLVREDWLNAQPARMVLNRQSPGVQRIEFERDAGKPVQSATVTLLAKYAAVLPGDRIDLTKLGKGSGRYLVSTVRRSRFRPVVSVELKRRTLAAREPLGEQVSSTRGKGGGGAATGTLQWPTTSHVVTSGFGHRSSPGGVGSTNHDGIDIGVPVGTAVHAADGGKVVKAGPNGGYGNYVEIDHGKGLHTFYGHLSKIEVRVGQAVDKGDTIARSGNTGTSTGAHLHFGLHKDGVGRDPRTYL